MAALAVYLDLVAGLGLCVTLGANNLSTCLGTAMGARALKYSHALALAALGVLAGILLEGSKLFGAITAGIVSANSSQFSLAAAVSTFVIMAFLTYRKLPISLSQVVVGAAVGSAVASGIEVNWYFTLLVASSWLLTPLIGVVAAIVLSLVTRRVAREVRRVFTLNTSYAYLTVLSGIYASYALGANTVGLIVGMVASPTSDHLLISLMFGMATIIGMILFSKGTARSVAENLVGLNPSASFAAQMGGAATVHGFTQFGMPVSISQAVVGGVFGAAIPRKIVVRNDRLTREIILGWTIAPLLGAALGYLFAAII